MARFVTIKKCSEETGYSEDAIRQKIARQDWKIGKVYVKAPDGRVLIDMDGYQKWVQESAELPAEQRQVSRSRSNIRVKGVVSRYHSSPPPLI